MTHDVREPAHALAVPALLDSVPFARVDEASLRDALVFGFATGDVGDLLERVAAEMPLAPSTWAATDFARDVFLGELLDRCMPIVGDGARHARTRNLLYRIVSAPPADPAVVAFRQAIFSELAARADLREALGRLYAGLVQLRSLLAKTGAVRIDPFERRLAILRAVRDLTQLAAASFTFATSGLARLGAWGRRVSRLPAFARLVELLSYEENVAELDVRLRLGFDGKIRDFSVIGRREPDANAFYRSPTARLLEKASLLVRGHSFSDHEIFARLTDDVFDGLAAELTPLFPLIGDLEFYLGGLAFRDGAARAGLEVSLATFGADASDGRTLEGLFNPLLVSESGRAVPCNLHVGRGDALVVITGPNSGGKTRLLQSLAICQILGQAGMFVPARRAHLPWASGLFVSLIEHAHADQSEGRLGTELLRIRRLFENLRIGSLVILDELCSGTNPSEGEDIFRLVVKLLGELRPATFITTHFLAFAARLAREEPTLEFLQVELDAAERPTYGFVPGVATTSLAHRTAARLGVTEHALRELLVANNPELACRSTPSPATEPSSTRRQTASALAPPRMLPAS